METKYPMVIKYPYLAEGKGVFICKDESAALEAIDKIKTLHEKDLLNYPFDRDVFCIFEEFLN